MRFSKPSLVTLLLLCGSVACTEDSTTDGSGNSGTRGGGATDDESTTSQAEATSGDDDAGDGSMAEDSGASEAEATGDEQGEDSAEAGGDESSIPDPRDAVDEARRELPDYLSLHSRVFARTCSPDNDVCHNNKEYPDLRTPLSMLASVAMPCNLALEDPIDTYNGCEARGDTLVFLNGDNRDARFELGFVEFVAGDAGQEMLIELREPIPEAMRDPETPENFAIRRMYPEGELDLIRVYGRAIWQAGDRQLRVIDIEGLGGAQQSTLRGELRVGDPNRDGVFGGDGQTMLEIAPGDPSASYLLGRLQASVPGTPMPLANEALSSAEMLAVTCWIETLDPTDEAADVHQVINYDDCEAALHFGEGDADSGHSLSRDVQPIFARYCNAGGCHDAETRAADLDLTAGRARAQLLRASSQDQDTPRVVPGNPANSYLMMKLWGTGVEGSRMPRPFAGSDSDELPAHDLAVIERWIVAGAPDD